MLYSFLQGCFDFNCLKYLIFRGFAAFLTSFLFSIFIYLIINKKLKIYQKLKGRYLKISKETNIKKRHTSLMGGVVIVITVLFSILLWCNLSNFFILILSFVFLSFGILGFIDDWKKLHTKEGIAAKSKFSFQIFIAFLASFTLYIYQRFDSVLCFPFLENIHIDLGFAYVFFMIFIIVTTSNAVNLTDRSDGLAIGPAITSAVAFAFFAYIVGNQILANYFKITYIQGSGELVVFFMALLGAELGFLGFNSFPNGIFMGDTGSLSIGAALGTAAIITKHEIALAIIGGIFVLETISVILQITYVKATNVVRLFLMVPLYRHFEKNGIHEDKIVVWAWIISIVLFVVTFSLFTL